VVLAVSCSEEPLEADFCEQSDIHSPCYTNLPEAAWEGGSLNIEDHVFGHIGPSITDDLFVRLLIAIPRNPGIVKNITV